MGATLTVVELVGSNVHFMFMVAVLDQRTCRTQLFGRMSKEPFNKKKKKKMTSKQVRGSGTKQQHLFHNACFCFFGIDGRGTGEHVCSRSKKNLVFTKSRSSFSSSA